MGQHNSFKKDIDMLSEAYGHMYGKEIVEEGKMGAGIGGGIGAVLGAGNPITAGLGAVAGDALTGEDDEHDKTGHLSDKDLLSKVEGMGTAGKCLIDAAKKRLDDGDSLTDHERDALARDAYGAAEKDIAKEDGEDHHHEDESYEQKMNKMGAAHGYTGSGKGHATD